MKRLSLVLMLAFPLAAWAGGHSTEAERTAAAHADDQPVASPLATAEPAQRVNSREAVYTRVDGVNVTGWLAWPADRETAGLPGVIVIHEWWGLNDNIRSTTERLAAEGYVALAVDLYRGGRGETPKEAMALMQQLNSAEDAGRENLVAAYEYLTDIMGATNVGSVGWRLGGRWSLQAALRLPDELDAMVMYYGAVVTDEAQLDTLQMPILGHFASTDPIVPPDTVEAFAASLAKLGKEAEVHIYPDTQHAFSNPSGLAYNKEAADLAWQRTTAFLAAHLQ